MDVSENNLPEYLTSFFEAWREIAKPQDVSEITLSERLASFFKELQKIPKEAPISPPAIKVDGNALGEFLAKFGEAKKEIDKEKRLGSAINVWKVAGIGENELRNSSILGWLLDNTESHGQGNEILSKLLALIPKSVESFSEYSGQTGNYWVQVESCPRDQKSRVDIVIKGDNLLLFIEVKVNANETGDQLDRYLGIANATHYGRPWCVIYLTRDEKPLNLRITKHDPSLDNSLVTISWKNITEVLSKQTQKLEPTSFSSQIIKQFVHHLKAF